MSPKNGYRRFVTDRRQHWRRYQNGLDLKQWFMYRLVASVFEIVCVVRFKCSKMFENMGIGRLALAAKEHQSVSHGYGFESSSSIAFAIIMWGHPRCMSSMRVSQPSVASEYMLVWLSSVG